MRPTAKLKNCNGHIFRDSFETLSRLFEECNEIEKRFFLACLDSYSREAGYIGAWQESVSIPVVIDNCAVCLYMAPQFKIAQYRVDFLIQDADASIKLVVEIDGHDFHEKTKEQARRDKKRERELTALGYRVIRFTGSEVFLNYATCWKETVSIFASIRRATVEGKT